MKNKFVKASKYILLEILAKNVRKLTAVSIKLTSNYTWGFILRFTDLPYFELYRVLCPFLLIKNLVHILFDSTAYSFLTIVKSDTKEASSGVAAPNLPKIGAQSKVSLKNQTLLHSEQTGKLCDPCIRRMFFSRKDLPVIHHYRHSKALFFLFVFLCALFLPLTACGIPPPSSRHSSSLLRLSSTV